MPEHGENIVASTPMLHDLVSVIMPVRNGAATIEAAIASITHQTYAAWELIIVNDGSDDATPEILRQYDQDSRIRVLSRPPSGIVISLNAGLAHARGELIARLDADDLAYSTRLAEQVAMFRSCPDLVLLGTHMDVVDTFGTHVDVLAYPSDDASLRRQLTKRNPFVHSSIMARRSAIDRVGGYRRALELAEDYDLWLRLAPLGKIGNLPQRLGAYRRGNATLSVRSNIRQTYAFAAARRCAQLRQHTGHDPLDEQTIPLAQGLGTPKIPHFLQRERSFFDLLQQFQDPSHAVELHDFSSLSRSAWPLTRTERRLAQDAIQLRLQRQSRSPTSTYWWAVTCCLMLDPWRAIRSLASGRFTQPPEASLTGDK